MIGYTRYVYKSGNLTYTTYYLTVKGVQFGEPMFSKAEVEKALLEFG